MNASSVTSCCVPQPRRSKQRLGHPASDEPEVQIAVYLKVLIERLQLIEKKLPVFTKPNARRSRYYIADNFLRSWLAALANPVSAIAFRPVDQLAREADQRPEIVEGTALEKLAG